MKQYIHFKQLVILFLILNLNLFASSSTECMTMDDAMQQAQKIDSDKDGIDNYADNCISIKNVAQKDRDNDDVGDVCDKCPDLPARGYTNGCPVDPSIDPDNLHNPSYRMRVKTHKGNYFSIDYPEDFKVVTSYSKDEAHFISPNKNVEYFVYSPLWGGEPVDYLTVKSSEKLIKEKTVKGKNNNPARDINRDMQITKWVSLQAKNGVYTRAYLHIKRKSSDETLKMGDIDLVFGFKYKNKKAYDIYKKAYKLFKNSLEQYAD